MKEATSIEIYSVRENSFQPNLLLDKKRWFRSILNGLPIDCEVSSVIFKNDLGMPLFLKMAVYWKRNSKHFMPQIGEQFTYELRDYQNKSNFLSSLYTSKYKGMVQLFQEEIAFWQSDAYVDKGEFSIVLKNYYFSFISTTVTDQA